MGRMYSAAFTGVSSGVAQQDVFELNAPATAAVIVHEFHLGQTTDVGDTNEELLIIQAIRGNTTSGSGGGTITPAEIFGSAAFGGTVERNNTTVATAGTPVTLLADAWNIRSPYLWVPTPEVRPVLAPSARLVFRLSAPGSALTLHGTLIFEAVS